MKNKNRILITGGTGFIGSHLCEYYVQKGYKVTSFDRYNVNYDLGNLHNSAFKKDINFIFGDIRDYDSVEKAFKNQDTILHLAALIGIPYSYNSPLAYLKTNVEGTYNVLEAVKKKSIDQVIITSTSEVYGSAQYLPMDEKHPLIGQSPYSASKIAADQLAISYFKSFKTPIKIIRPFNTFGPRQSARAVIPTIINQVLYEKQVKIGNIYPKRDYIYVKNLVKAYEKISQKKEYFGKVVNVGSGENFSIKQIFDKILTITNSKKKLVFDKNRSRKKTSEVNNLLADIKLLKRISNWKVNNNFEKNLQETISWFKTNKLKTSAKKFIV